MLRIRLGAAKGEMRLNYKTVCVTCAPPRQCGFGCLELGSREKVHVRYGKWSEFRLT